MTSLHSIVAASALALVTSAASVMGATTASQAAPADKAGVAQAGELSSAKRVYHRRQVSHYKVRRYPVRHYETPRYSAYLRGSDPAFGPDGRPYGPPAHLRGQCYIDEGYGRFSACPNR